MKSFVVMHDAFHGNRSHVPSPPRSGETVLVASAGTWLTLADRPDEGADGSIVKHR